MLHVSSANKGLMIPQVDNTQVKLYHMSCHDWCYCICCYAADMISCSMLYAIELQYAAYKLCQQRVDDTQVDNTQVKAYKVETLKMMLTEVALKHWLENWANHAHHLAVDAYRHVIAPHGSCHGWCYCICCCAVDMRNSSMLHASELNMLHISCANNGLMIPKLITLKRSCMGILMLMLHT